MRDATKLGIYFNDNRALFLIPLYQRKYSWEKKHCQRLFADLLKIHEQRLYSHFFGSIVSVRASETENDMLIIDGQQRITTISILILAAINAFKNGLIVCDNPDIIRDTYEKFLIAKYRRGVERKIKLRPIDDDMKAYDALFSNDESTFVPAEQSGITSNYKFFYNLIVSQDKLIFDDLIEAIERLIIIDICLDSKDNPQLIFESLNSCGKDLEEADKVRNYLLMSETKESQEEYYYKYWRKIEQCTENEPTMFIRDYLTIKRKVISSIGDLYFDFKLYDEEANLSREELLGDMLKYAQYYKQASKGETGNENVDKKLRQLANIGSNVCMPFYMQFLDFANEQGISKETQYEVFDAIENYWARRIMCGWPTNVMAKIFALMHSDIMRIYNTHKRRGLEVTVNYAELMKYVLLRKQGVGVFPNDNDIEEIFPKRQVYKMAANYRMFLFERMENMNSKESNDSIIPKMNKGDITIEHIMPQHLSAQWKKDLGENAEEIKEKYLHTFANLTLTGYNQEYSNRPYAEKWAGYTIEKKNKETSKVETIEICGYKDSVFKLSNYMKTHEQWTETELIERGNLLLGNFLKLWPMITTEYVPLEKEVEIVSFDDDDAEFTNRSIAAFRYKNERHQVSTWKEMLVELCKLLYKEKTTEMLYLATKCMYLHSKQQYYTSMVAESCHVWTSNSTKTKQAILQYIFKELNIAPSDLEIELQPISEKGNNEIEED